MKQLIEALDLALEALERLDGWLALRYGSGLTPQEQQVITAIKQARSAPYVALPRVQDTEAHYKGVIEGVQKLFNGKRSQPAPVQEPVEKHYVDGGHIVYPAAQRQWTGLTDESVVSAAARVLSDRVAASCNVDCGDMWMLHGNDSIEDARAMLEAAEAKLKENT